LKVNARIIPSEFGKPGAWLAEIVMPFDKLGGTPASGTKWNINLTRTRPQLNVKDWQLTWAEMPGGTFHQPERFKPVTFK